MKHQNTHDPKIFCQEPGCNAWYRRKDNLVRHYRNAHPDSVAIASTSGLSSDAWTTPPPVNASLDECIDPRLLSPTFMSDDHHLKGTESDPSTALASIEATKLEQGHLDSIPHLWETTGANPLSDRFFDEIPAEVFWSSEWSWHATEFEGEPTSPSHANRTSPLRDASPFSAEHYNSPTSGSPPLEQSKIAKDLVFFETASSDSPAHVGRWPAADDNSFNILSEHHEQSRRRSHGTIFTRDFDDDESSCAESVFSQESTASTATSLGGSLGTTSFLEMVNRTASALFAGDVVHSINSAAVEDPGIRPERYRRNIRRMIKTFGKSLKAEADTFTERRIAAAMQTRRISTHVAHEIMARTEGPRSSCRRTVDASERVNEEQHSDTSTDSADEDEVVLTQEPEDEAKIRNFVLDSDACMQFKRTLLDFVHKPYEKRIMTALDSSLNRTACPDKDVLARAAREISWVPVELLCFSHDRSLTVADRFKGYIEDFMGETWNWSPFSARRHSLQSDCCRLSWKSVSL